MKQSERSADEASLEAFFLDRLGKEPGADTRAVARDQAHTMYCLTLLVIEDLQRARDRLMNELLPGLDSEVAVRVLHLRDRLGNTIVSELLAWGRVHSAISHLRSHVDNTIAFPSPKSGDTIEE